ncbi:hypothetical protein SNEBB_008898 [Seison nebaliae]|nr:hypothetical protein SNEBB_008898 [Seison nebaliae]
MSLSTKFILFCGLVYMGIFLRNIYNYFDYKQCSLQRQREKNHKCLFPFYSKESQLIQLSGCITHSTKIGKDCNCSDIIMKNLEIFNSSQNDFLLEFTKKNISHISRENGTINLHLFMHESGLYPKFMKKCFREKRFSEMKKKRTINKLKTPSDYHDRIYFNLDLSKYQLIKKKKNLLKTIDSFNEPDVIYTHYWNKIPFRFISNPEFVIDLTAVPRSIHPHLKIDSSGKYLPIIEKEIFRHHPSYLQILDSNQINFTLHFRRMNVPQFEFWSSMDSNIPAMKELGIKEDALKEVRDLLTFNNVYILFISVLIMIIHMLLDVLAFKNDINYWRNQSSMVGISLRTIIWRVISQTIILLHLIDSLSSYLVIIPLFVGIVVEIWKLMKAMKISFKLSSKFPFFYMKLGEKSNAENASENFDSEMINKLFYLIIPLCIGSAVYSLLYYPQKSWYSWTVTSLVHMVYYFGFLFMLPQVFLNYKLKSVAHLPIRVFLYKGFNTIIDDVYATILSMPTSHRLACFRDDIVFVIFLYQYYIYDTDKKRVNEYGQSFTNDKSNKEEEPQQTLEEKKKN